MRVLAGPLFPFVRSLVVASALLGLVATGGAACVLPGGDCDGGVWTASATRAPLAPTSAAWTDAPCGPDDESLCDNAIPPDSSLLLCTHDPSTLDARDGDGGAGVFLALKCDYYRDGDPSCHSTDSEHHHHHHLDTGGITIPGH